MANLSLVFDLVGRDISASRAFKDVGDSAERAGKQGENSGGLIAKGMKLAAGALLGAGLIEGFKSLYDAAAESAKIGALTSNVIRSTGGAAGVSAKQVGDLASAIAKKTGVDDEAIQSGENLLLTFTSVRNEVGKGNDIFNQATSVITDMSVALGQDTSSSAIQLGKALNDPIKGVSALQKVGVSFTATQKEQITTLVESGRTMDAQKLILAELSKEFGGAAEAAATPFGKLQQRLGDLAETLGAELIPYVDKFSTFLIDEVLPAVQDVGGTVAGDLGPALGLAADLLKGVYEAGSGVLGFFNDLPGPLQAVVVGLGAAAALKGPIGGLLETLRDTGQTAALRALYLKDAVTGLGGAGGVAKAGLGGLVGFFGGPWGLALTGATIGLGFLVSALGKSSEKADDAARSQSDLAQALRDSEGVIDDNVRSAAAKEAQDKGLLKLADQLGLSLPQVTDAVLGNKSAYDSLTASSEAYLQSVLHRNGNNTEDAGFVRAQEAAGAFKSGLDELAPTVAQTAAEQEQLSAATDGTASSSTVATQAIDTFQTGLEDTATAAGDARQQTDLFKTSLDVLTGTNVSLVEVQSQLQNSLAAAKDAMTAEGGAVIDAAGALDLHSENGRKAADVLLDVRNSGNELIGTMIQQGATTDEVSAKDAELRQSFIETAEQMGISEAAGNALADQILGIPGERTTTITADTAQATAAVDAVQKQIDLLHGRQVLITAQTSFIGAASDYSTPSLRGGTGLATGGPVFGPGTGTSDSIPAMLSNGEHVLTAREVRAAGGHGAIKQWRQSLTQAFAEGGPVAPISIQAELDARAYNTQMDAAAGALAKQYEPVQGFIGALQWARSQVGKPYIWGSAGPAGYDCSGFMSAITNVIRGRSPYSRVGSTASFPWAGFDSGYGQFTVGSTPDAGGGIGHMAGTLLGVNVESTGSVGVRVGSTARGASNGLFTERAHLGTFDSGGYLQPGYTLAFNGTGQAERVRTAEQEAALGVSSISLQLAGEDVRSLLRGEIVTVLTGSTNRAEYNGE